MGGVLSMALEALLPLSHTGIGMRGWERLGLPAKGEGECWEGEDSIPGHIAEKLLWYCIFYLQSPSQTALAGYLQPL